VTAWSGALEALGDGISALDAVVLFPGAASIIDITDFRMIAGQSAAFSEPACPARAGDPRASPAVRRMQCIAFSRGTGGRVGCCAPRDLCDGTALPMTQELLRATDRGFSATRYRSWLTRCSEAGIISYSRGRIEITDSDALQATACECYATVKAKIRAATQDRALMFGEEFHMIDTCDCAHICTLGAHTSARRRASTPTCPPNG